MSDKETGVNTALFEAVRDQAVTQFVEPIVASMTQDVQILG